MAIREVLEEELENSLRMEQRYSEELDKLPQGSLVQKSIKGHAYHYLVLRDESGRVKLVYKGKVEPEEVARYAEIKQQRAQYRNLRAKAREQIRFLRRALRAEAAV
ncbi:MAG: hypothetical protein WC334_02975 [Kiritimatiellales bacterium]|jgi:hypothetical protein